MFNMDQPTIHNFRALLYEHPRAPKGGLEVDLRRIAGHQVTPGLLGSTERHRAATHAAAAGFHKVSVETSLLELGGLGMTWSNGLGKCGKHPKKKSSYCS